MSTWVTGTTVVENSTDATNLTSNVTITLIVGWNGGSWASDNPAYYINVNGSRVKSGTANFNTGEASSGSQTIATWTGDVPHNSDGTGSMTWAVGYEGIYAGEGIYSTASGTKTLTPIVIPDPDPPTPTGDGNYLDKTGLEYFYGKLKDIFALKGESGGTNNLVTLWTNPSPSSDFNGQVVTLADSADNYDMLIFVSKYGTGDTRRHTDVLMKGETKFTITTYQESTTATSSDTTMAWRNVTISGTSATINNAMYNAASAGGYNRANICIPLYIFGANIRSTAFERAKTLLWTNPSPTSTFAAQTVTLSQDTSNYDAFIVEMVYGNGVGDKKSEMLINDGSAHEIMCPRNATSSVYAIGWRSVTITGTQAVFSGGIYMSTTSGNASGQSIPIPLAIYGIKFGGATGTPMPTEYVSNLTWTDWANTKTLTWTVHGSGFVYVTASTRASTNNDTGTTYAEILLNGNLVAVDLNRLTSASTVRLSASTSAMMNVSDGDTITINLSNTKGGTAEGYRRAMAFGCTLT